MISVRIKQKMTIKGNEGLLNSDFLLWRGDCLEEMKNITDNSVDMILTDPPYVQ